MAKQFDGARRRLVTFAAALMVLQVHAQTTPPPRFVIPSMAPPQLPPIAHERQPTSWPQPDYFDEALKFTQLQPGARSKAFALGPLGSRSNIVLPVQVQAFGFSPQFRAWVGAQLDQALLEAGVDATRQTEITGLHGPFVRRFDEAQIEALANAHPQQRIVALYVGHDGVDRLFLTLETRAGGKRTVSHREAALPTQAEAMRRIAEALPELLKQADLSPNPAPAAAPRAGRCAEATWTFDPLQVKATASQRACRAIAVGALLPRYDIWAPGSMEAVSPARLAWLAEAHVQASLDAPASATSRAIRDLAAVALALEPSADLERLLAMTRLDDPVVSRLAKLETLVARTEQSPARSAHDARDKELEQITTGLPELARALLAAQVTHREPFARPDLCAIERRIPGLMLRPACRGEVPVAGQSRMADPAEALMLQEWRLATAAKSIYVEGVSRGSPTGLRESLSALSADLVDHPYMARLRTQVMERRDAAATFDDQLKLERERARLTVQSLVELQRVDHWLNAYSLSEHMWTSNSNIHDDPRVRELVDTEARLLSVLAFDRFGQSERNALRKAGDPPFFLAPDAFWVRQLAGPPGIRVVPTANAPPAPAPPLAAPREKRLFAALAESADARPEAELAALVERRPADLSTRVALAFHRLGAGGNLDDAIRLIDARPTSQRSDDRIQESHAWSNPAHRFYFAAEPEAAQRYYEKVVSIGSGSESDLMARVRLRLLDGQWQESLDATRARLSRYESDYTRRDLATQLFLQGRAPEAWAIFLARAQASNNFQLWMAAFAGHRIEGARLPQIESWLAKQGFESSQVNFRDVGMVYLHLHAVVDRIPSGDDLELLLHPRGQPHPYVQPVWAASARLFRSALEDGGHAEARDAVVALRTWLESSDAMFMLPTYAWVTWHASEGKDELLDRLRRATPSAAFDALLAKSMVLALDGKTEESLRDFAAARFQLANTAERLLPASYSYALAGYLMYRKTRKDGYRHETLRFVRAYQRVFPFFGYLYSLEALLDTDPQRRNLAACRARFLDPQSHFLKLAKVSDTGSCGRALWAGQR